MWDFKKLLEQEREQRRQNLKLLLLLLLLTGMLILAGCSLAQKLQSLKEVKTPQGGDLLELSEGVDELPRIQEKTWVNLYFLDSEGSLLVRRKVEIPKVPGIARAAMERLCQGPPGKDLLPCLPSGTTVRDLNVKADGTCVVDLSRNAANIAGHDPKAEALAVSAVVNTLTEFPTVKRVQILVEGQSRKTLAGHIPIDLPLIRNLSFVKQ